MKSIIIYAAIAIIFFSQSASAQTGTSVKKGKTSEVLLAVQTSAAEQHVSLMDKMQRETEELIMNITPAPLLSLASKIHEKLDAVKEKKSKKKSKSKSCQSTCNL